MHTAELQNSEKQVAKLRDEGERLRFPHGLLQDVYKLEVCVGMRAWVFFLESRCVLCLIYFLGWYLLSPFQDVLDSMWGILRARYLELSSPFLSKSLQTLLQGMAELVSIGKGKLAADPLQHAKSKAALQAQLQDHKVRAPSRPSPPVVPEDEKFPSDPFILNLSVEQQPWELQVGSWMKTDSFLPLWSFLSIEKTVISPISL